MALSARLAAVVDALPLRPDALHGRHPEAGQKAFARIAAVLAPGGRLFVDDLEVALR